MAEICGLCAAEEVEGEPPGPRADAELVWKETSNSSEPFDSLFSSTLNIGQYIVNLSNTYLWVKISFLNSTIFFVR